MELSLCLPVYLTQQSSRSNCYERSPSQCYDYSVFQGISNGGRQFLSHRRSNRHMVPLYGKSDRLFTRERKLTQR